MVAFSNGTWTLPAPLIIAVSGTVACSRGTSVCREPSSPVRTSAQIGCSVCSSMYRSTIEPAFTPSRSTRSWPPHPRSTPRSVAAISFLLSEDPAGCPAGPELLAPGPTVVKPTTPAPTTVAPPATTGDRTLTSEGRAILPLTGRPPLSRYADTTVQARGCVCSRSPQRGLLGRDQRAGSGWSS